MAPTLHTAHLIDNRAASRLSMDRILHPQSVAVLGASDNVAKFGGRITSFLVKHGSLYVGRVKAEKGTTEACLFVPRPGTYALAIYHDTNGNQKFDRTMIGLPAEAYGFSNNPNTFFGLPNFGSVRYRVAHSGQTTKIRLTYP